MFHKFLATCALLIGLGLPVQAFDLNEMSAAERQIFRDEIRAYLLENPEVLVEAINVLEQRQKTVDAQTDQDLIIANAAALFDDGFSYVGGNPDGDVTVVEFLDYKCGFCKRAHPDITELVKSDGNIRYIVKEFPILGEQSLLGARFAVSVLLNSDHETYGAAHDRLMTLRGDINGATLERLATSLGLDATRVMGGMNDASVTRIIEENRALGVRMKISGTPTFVLGDQMLRGYLPLQGMRKIVANLRQDS